MGYIMDGLFQLLKLRDVIQNAKFSRPEAGSCVGCQSWRNSMHGLNE